MLIARSEQIVIAQQALFGALNSSIMGCLWLVWTGDSHCPHLAKRPWTKDHCFHCGYPRKVAERLDLQ